MEPTSQLAWHDLQWCLRRAPLVLLETLQKHGPLIIVAGGYVRSCVTGEDINDIDLFVGSKTFAMQVAGELANGELKRIHATDNAFTVKGHKCAIQVIHRWTFDTPEAAILSFDFTIARAAFWWVLPQADINIAGKWASVCDSRYYSDLAGKRLIYCAPDRIEEVGGSMLRVLKFYQRGYRIPLDSLGAVVARLVSGVNPRSLAVYDERQMGKVLTGFLREVDPNIDPDHIAHLPSQTQSEDGAAVPQA
jgi:hypothetical protein